MGGALLKGSLARGLIGGLLFGFGSPPGLFPGAELLTLAGLGLWLDGVQRSSRPLLGAAVWGAVWLGCLAWPLRHVTQAGVALMPVVAALYLAALAWFTRLAHRRLGSLTFVLWFACAWGFFEWLRGHQPELTYPHGQLAHAFYDWPAVLLPVRLVGEAGMNALCAGLVAGILHGLRAVGEGWRRGLALAGVAMAWAVLSLPAGSIRPDGERLRVVLVQTGLAMYPDLPGFRYLRRLAAHNRALAAGLPPADLVVWPESAASSWLSEDTLEPAYLASVARRLTDGRTAFLFGTQLYPAGADPATARYRNAAILSAAGGAELLGRREKRRLVPAGETIPILPLLLPESWMEKFFAWLRERFPFVPNLLPGRELPLPRLEDGRGVGILICFENAYPGEFAALAEEGAGFFAVVSNEAWYRDGVELDQMLAMSVFRSLETGRPVVRATTDGITCHVTANGRVVASLPTGRPGLLPVEVQPVRGDTPAMRWGTRVPWLLLGACFLLLLRGKTRSAPTARPQRR